MDKFVGKVNKRGVRVHRDDPRTWDGTEKRFEGYHAHVLTSTRQLEADGFGGKATPEISDTERRKMGLGFGAAEIERVRRLGAARQPAP